MKFYTRQKPYRYGVRTVFFWKYKATNGKWKHGGQVYWGNRETDAITRPIDGIKRIAELSDGVERRYLIGKTDWLNRGVEDYSDEHFSKSIYLRLQELKKAAPKLPEIERPPRSYSPRAQTPITKWVKHLMSKGNGYLPTEKLQQLREAEARFNKNSTALIEQATNWANQVRGLGESLETLTGKQRFSQRDFLQLQPLLPKGVTLNFCRSAMSVWRKHPEPIGDAEEAMKIMEKMLPNLPEQLL